MPDDGAAVERIAGVPRTVQMPLLGAAQRTEEMPVLASPAPREEATSAPAVALPARPPPARPPPARHEGSLGVTLDAHEAGSDTVSHATFALAPAPTSARLGPVPSASERLAGAPARRRGLPRSADVAVVLVVAALFVAAGVVALRWTGRPSSAGPAGPATVAPPALSAQATASIAPPPPPPVSPLPDPVLVPTAAASERPPPLPVPSVRPRAPADRPMVRPVAPAPLPTVPPPHPAPAPTAPHRIFGVDN